MTVDVLKSTKRLLGESVTSAGSFSPNLTSGMIFHHSEKSLSSINAEEEPKRILELGCGCGVISLMLKKAFPHCEFALSDIVATSVKDAKVNFAANGLSADIRCSDMFEGWGDDGDFDIIVYDISGISTDVARISPWFQLAHYDGNEDGISHLRTFLTQAQRYLTPGGIVIFPLISLSRVDLFEPMLETLTILDFSQAEWPLPLDMFPPDALETIKRQGVSLVERNGVLSAWTRVYVAKI